MIEKDKLIEQLKDATTGDAYLISVYANHIKNALPYSTLKKEVVEAVLDALQRRREVSESHKIMISRLVESISKGDKNVY